MCCSRIITRCACSALAYDGAEILASDATRDLIVERGQQDKDSEIGRFPRLFRAVESIPGLTWPTITFPQQMSVWLGKREVRIMHIGRGHTAGDVIAWVPDANVVFSGDLVEYHSACYCGDAHLADWPKTLDRLAQFKAQCAGAGARRRARDPGQGAPRHRDARATFSRRSTVRRKTASRKVVAEAGLRRRARSDGSEIRNASRSTSTACRSTSSRAYDEAKGIAHPVIWTAERDREMWAALQG